jgi:hypothetical protein
MNWRQNPQRVAWIILGVSFVAFCMLAVVVPLSVRGFVLHATRSQPTFATVLAGTAQVYPPGANDPIAVTAPRELDEGSRVLTDASTRALVSVLVEDAEVSDELLALTTVQLSQDTAMRAERMRRPRFNRSPDPYQVAFDLEQGRIFVTTQPPGERSVAVTLNTPQAEILFSNGSYDVMIDGDKTQVRAQSGEATGIGAGQQVNVSSGERTEIAAGQAPAAPVSAALDMVLNGSFEGRISPPWQQITEVSPGLPAGEMSVAEDGQRNAVRFYRSAEDGAPNRVGVLQVVDRDVQGYDALTLRFDAKIASQSVPAGGYLATEYPVMVDVFYTDIYGKDLHWYQGLYSLDLPEGSTYLPPTGEKIPLGIWYTYESPNLYEFLQETRPARINSITLYASGHDYESFVSNVALTVR